MDCACSEAKFHATMKELTLLEANLAKNERIQQRCLMDIQHFEGVRSAIGTSVLLAVGRQSSRVFTSVHAPVQWRKSAIFNQKFEI